MKSGLQIGGDQSPWMMGMMGMMTELAESTMGEWVMLSIRVTGRLQSRINLEYDTRSERKKNVSDDTSWIRFLS